MELEGGWKVVEKLVRKPGSTGGNFSIGYRVKRGEGEFGFLKAIDISRELLSGDPQALQDQTEIFLHERDLLAACGDCNHIVVALSSGTIKPNTIPDTLPLPVFYLIFELASGDARQQMNSKSPMTTYQRFRTLQHISAGLQEMHKRLFAHQDIKPSNILLFGKNVAAQEIYKLADLGRAHNISGANPNKLKNMPAMPILLQRPST